MRVSARVSDVLLAAAVAVAITIAIAAETEENAKSPDALAYALGITMAAITPLRRRHPVALLAATLVLLQAYYSLSYPAIASALPLMVPVFAAASAGRLGLAFGAIALISAMGLGYRLVLEGESLLNVLAVGSLVEVSLLVACALLGDAVRARRGWAQETARRVELAGQAARDEERVRIARDLHDVLAHTISTITVHAGVAADELGDSSPQAREALRTIRESSREAMAELRATVGLLRDGEPAPRSPTPGLHELDGLLGSARAAGIDVDVAVEGTARPLPGAVDLTAYRIVQEALTNVVRHAQARNAKVRIGFEPEALVLDVSDDGRGAPPSPNGGHGLRGMRERAAVLGGTLEAGPAGERGFTVRARLPVTGGAT